MERINIAIDGPSAAGKSTISSILAEKLQYSHLDTGAMYRCVGYVATMKNIALDDEIELEKIIKNINISFAPNGDVFIDGVDVSKEIRTNEISMCASKVSANPRVRELLVEMQQRIAKDKGFIMDGRDIGTVVLKDAKVKIYLVATIEARALRRFKEYQEKNIPADYEIIYSDIKKRDHQDMNRKTSPLKKADDALEIDTSNMDIEEVVATIEEYILQVNG